jgi:hypothetical protein
LQRFVKIKKLAVSTASFFILLKLSPTLIADEIGDQGDLHILALIGLVGPPEHDEEKDCAKPAGDC